MQIRITAAVAVGSLAVFGQDANSPESDGVDALQVYCFSSESYTFPLDAFEYPADTDLSSQYVRWNWFRGKENIAGGQASTVFFPETFTDFQIDTDQTTPFQLSINSCDRTSEGEYHLRLQDRAPVQTVARYTLSVLKRPSPPDLSIIHNEPLVELEDATQENQIILAKCTTVSKPGAIIEWYEKSEPMLIIRSFKIETQPTESLDSLDEDGYVTTTGYFAYDVKREISNNEYYCRAKLPEKFSAETKISRISSKGYKIPQVQYRPNRPTIELTGELLECSSEARPKVNSAVLTVKIRGAGSTSVSRGVQMKVFSEANALALFDVGIVRDRIREKVEKGEYSKHRGAIIDGKLHLMAECYTINQHGQSVVVSRNVKSLGFMPEFYQRSLFQNITQTANLLLTDLKSELGGWPTPVFWIVVSSIVIIALCSLYLLVECCCRKSRENKADHHSLHSNSPTSCCCCPSKYTKPGSHVPADDIANIDFTAFESERRHMIDHQRKQQALIAQAQASLLQNDSLGSSGIGESLQRSGYYGHSPRGGIVTVGPAAMSVPYSGAGMVQHDAGPYSSQVVNFTSRENSRDSFANSRGALHVGQHVSNGTDTFRSNRGIDDLYDTRYEARHNQSVSNYDNHSGVGRGFPVVDRMGKIDSVERL